ncbi:MAG: peptidoglycan-binding domain-containing protein [Bryobacteraceae bacterium]
MTAKAVPRGQQSPSTDRVSEIQKALIDRGYAKGEPTGTWGPDSADALRRFQEDNKISPTGKLNSMSLIHLGLGPKRDAIAQRKTEGQKP